MKRVLTFTLLLAMCLGANAQEAAIALIRENPDRAANNMHSYEFFEIKDTPAPKGFKPFYITHYGRHGSRYEDNHTFANAAMAGFAKLDSLNLLTAEGKKLYGEVSALVDEHIGMEGVLTPRGAREHQMIAARMADRYPEIFKNKERQEISCFSSTKQRCILSMTNFAYSLQKKFPKLSFTFTSGERYMSYINPSLYVRRPGSQGPSGMPGMPAGGFQRPAGGQGNGQRPAGGFGGFGGSRTPQAPGIDLTRFLKPLFTDYEAAYAQLDNPESFVRAIYSAGGLCQVLDFMGLDIFREYFTPEELAYFWKNFNNMSYMMWGGSKENGETIRYAIRPLLKDFVEKADAALSDGSHRAADLRFGHDTSVLPLAALLGIDDTQHRIMPFQQANEMGWYSFFQVPMATNCQMVFYKNKKGEVLTKVLYNEKEVDIPGVEAVSGPYYRWSDLRAHFMKLCAD